MRISSLTPDFINYVWFIQDLIIFMFPATVFFVTVKMATNYIL